MQPKKLQGLERELQKIRRWKGRPSLAHGDIRLKNVVLDKTEKITAILDWENCISSMAPYWELSIALHDLTMDEKETFLEGYGLGLDEYLEIAPSIKALNLLNYAPYLQRALKRKDKARLQELRARLNGAFDLYSL